MADRDRTGPVIIGGSDTRRELLEVGGGRTVEVVPLATAARGREYAEAAVRSLRGRGIRAWTRPDRNPPSGDDFDWWEVLVGPDDLRPARLALSDYVFRPTRSPRPRRSP